jgi:hypothetical protein
MTDAIEAAGVSLSRSPVSKTPRHPRSDRDSTETIAETPDLKALARLVFARDTRRDSNQDTASRPSPQTEMPAETVSAVETVAVSWAEAEEEHAAHVEYDGGIPRAWAEGYAMLDPDRPPVGVPPRRWRAVIDAIGSFLDRWAAVAAALGWKAADIFGADAARPEVTWLNAGPLWSGDEARVVEVHADRIVFETKGGARQSAYRRPHLRPRSLPWELKR